MASRLQLPGLLLPPAVLALVLVVVVGQVGA
jgi:hypothetical protein